MSPRLTPVSGLHIFVGETHFKLCVEASEILSHPLTLTVFPSEGHTTMPLDLDTIMCNCVFVFRAVRCETT